MNQNDFETQALKFFTVCQQFPDLVVSWDGCCLSFHVYSKIDWDVRVIFSFAYNCPVLYFRPRTNWLPIDILSNYIKQGLDYVSPSEFPLTSEPFYFLHPCRSQELLRICNLSAWLSIVLPYISIKLPIEIFLEYEKSREC